MRALSLPETPRTLPVAFSRYAFRIAAPPVMIMVVKAAPSKVPATPKREVTVAAPADARPAAIIPLLLTMGPELSEVSLLIVV